MVLSHPPLSSNQTHPLFLSFFKGFVSPLNYKDLQPYLVWLVYPSIMTPAMHAWWWKSWCWWVHYENLIKRREACLPLMGCMQCKWRFCVTFYICYYILYIDVMTQLDIHSVESHDEFSFVFFISCNCGGCLRSSKVSTQIAGMMMRFLIVVHHSIA